MCLYGMREGAITVVIMSVYIAQRAGEDVQPTIAHANSVSLFTAYSST